MGDYHLLLTFHHCYTAGNYGYCFHSFMWKQGEGNYSNAFVLKSGWKLCTISQGQEAVCSLQVPQHCLLQLSVFIDPAQSDRATDEMNIKASSLNFPRISKMWAQTENSLAREVLNFTGGHGKDQAQKERGWIISILQAQAVRWVHLHHWPTVIHFLSFICICKQNWELITAACAVFRQEKQNPRLDLVCLINSKRSN